MMSQLKNLSRVLSNGVGAVGLIGMGGATGGLLLWWPLSWFINFEALGYAPTDVLSVCMGACAFLTLSGLIERERQWGREEEREKLQQNSNLPRGP